MTEEIWKDIEGYEGRYQVSNLGRVKSIKHYDSRGHLRAERVLKPTNDWDGYLRVNLYKNRVQVNKTIHRLVAEAFIPNPENKPTVNHIDENKTNNNVNNLEWATMKEQNSHGTRLKRFSESNSKPIIAIDIANGEYTEYNSGKECAIQLGLNHGHISSVLKGKRRQTGGYVFKYLDKSLDT